jgi:uroporphyrinogen-III synthase
VSGRERGSRDEDGSGSGLRDFRVAVFRPDDGRLADAVDLIESLGAEPVADPMLAIEPTGAEPRADADYAILTSRTGVDLVSDAGWEPRGTVCAIGTTTAGRLRAAGYDVGVVPEEFSSAGLVAALADRVDGARVEIARSDHGSETLPDGLGRAGAYVHETVLYRLVRPAGSGESAALAAAGDLDAALFTSSLTVEHFLEAAAERGERAAAVAGLNGECAVGAIGAPTAETAREAGIEVDVVPEEASFEALATETIEAGAPTYRD